MKKAWAATLLLVSATLGASMLADRRHPTPLARPLETIPTKIAGWTLAAETPLQEDVLAQLKPTSYLSRIYLKGSSRLELLIVYYADQRAGESMHSPEHCLPGGGWQLGPREAAALPLRDRNLQDKTMQVNRYVISHAGDNQILYYWYQSRHRVIAEEYAGKALLVWDALSSGHTEGSLVRVISRQDTRDFAAGVLAELDRCF